MPPGQKKLSRAEASADTRRALVEAAGDVFADRGYEAASVNDLAHAAGYTIGALYTHFAGKEALFLAVIEWEVKERRRRRRLLLKGASTTDAEIEALARQLSDDTPDARRSALLFQEFWLYAARHADSRPEIAAGYRAWQDEFVTAIADWSNTQDGSGDISAPARAAMILALADGLSRRRLLSPEVATSQTLIDGIRLLLGRSPA
jgi:AcrR family transcriptional regulator